MLSLTRLRSIYARLRLPLPTRKIKKEALVARVVEDERLARKANVDPSYYKGKYPDVTAAGLDPVEHYLEYGKNEGRFARWEDEDFYNRVQSFDPIAYLEINPDVATDGVDPLEHFLTFGRNEGRETARQRTEQLAIEGFDAQYYLSRNEDVAEAGIDPYLHYVHHGRREGRARSRDDERNASRIAAFDSVFYLSRYPDVANEGLDPLMHFIDFGIDENRLGNPQEAILEERAPNWAPSSERIKLSETGCIAEDTTSFDAYNYQNSYPDLAGLSSDSATLEKHWRDHGFLEGREAVGLAPFPIRPSISFNGQRPKIVCFGFLNAPSGLGTAARGYIAAFEKIGLQVQGVEVFESNGRLYTKGEYIQDIEETPHVNVFVLNADMINLFILDGRMDLLTNSYNIAIWYWELAYFPGKWLTAFGALDEIWTASTFCRCCFQALAPIPVTLMPPPLIENVQVGPMGREHFGLPKNAFIFGSIFDIGSLVKRKHPAILIEAFIENFGGCKKTHLAIKYHGAHHSFEEVRLLHKMAEGRDNIHFFGTIMDPDEIASFKAALDCYVSPHRGEGFGYNIAEALMLEKSVIATDYGGSADFFDGDVGYPVGYSLVEVGEGVGPYPASALWADPDRSELAKMMQEVSCGRSHAAAKAVLGQRRISQAYSIPECSRRIQERLAEICCISGPVTLDRPQTRQPLILRREQNSGLRFTVILMVTAGEPSAVLNSLNSILDQTHKNFEVFITCDGDYQHDSEILHQIVGRDQRIKFVRPDLVTPSSCGVNAAVEASSGRFVLTLSEGDQITPNAFFYFNELLESDPACDFVYSDEAFINEAGVQTGEDHKPDWSPEHLESRMYLPSTFVIGRLVFLKCGGYRATFKAAGRYDLALRASSEAVSVRHIPRILVLSRVLIEGALADTSELQYLDALKSYVAKDRPAATVERGLVPSTYRVRDLLNENARVTLLILTDNRNKVVGKRNNINLFDNLVSSIYEKTVTKVLFSIIAIDNGNLTEAQQIGIRSRGGKVFSYESPAGQSFNFSRKANFGFSKVEDDIVVMLNDDMEIISQDWLDALLELVQKPSVGVVGSRLYFANDTLQHCGIVLGINNDAAHIYHRANASLIGYHQITHLIRNYSAVTGACIAMRMSLVRELGGFDEALAIDYNDIDFCLRAARIGFRNVFTPFSSLYHFEGATATRTSSREEERILFNARWHNWIMDDPYYNPNLSRFRIDYS